MPSTPAACGWCGHEARLARSFHDRQCRHLSLCCGAHGWWHCPFCALTRGCAVTRRHCTVRKVPLSEHQSATLLFSSATLSLPSATFALLPNAEAFGMCHVPNAKAHNADRQKNVKDCYKTNKKYLLCGTKDLSLQIIGYGWQSGVSSAHARHALSLTRTTIKKPLRPTETLYDENAKQYSIDIDMPPLIAFRDTRNGAELGAGATKQ